MHNASRQPVPLHGCSHSGSWWVFVFVCWWWFLGGCFVLDLHFLYLLLITNYAPGVSSSHHCEEPGPDVPDDLLEDVKGLLRRLKSILFFRLKQPSSPSLPSQGLCSSLLITLMVPPLGLLPVYVFPGSRTQNQIQLRSTEQRGIITSL